MSKYTMHDALKKASVYAYSTPLGLNRDEKNGIWRRKYRKYLKKYVPSSTDDSLQNENNSNFIFTCWLQGYDDAPLIVKKCIDSIRNNAKDKKVVVISDENIEKFVKIPTMIHEKWKKGIITNTHFSDILRTLLLYEYGGLWIDATVMLFDSIPKYVEDSSLFFYKSSFLTSDDPSISNWLMFAKKPKNPFIDGLRIALLNYWQVNNTCPDYYVFHDFVTIMSESPIFEGYWNKIPYYENVAPHLLQHELFFPYSANRFKQIIRVSTVQKLTYKFSLEQSNKANTNLRYLLDSE